MMDGGEEGRMCEKRFKKMGEMIWGDGSEWVKEGIEILKNRMDGILYRK